MSRTLIILTLAGASSVFIAAFGAFAARRAYKWYRPFKRRAIMVLVGTALMILAIIICALLLLTTSQQTILSLQRMC